VYKWEAAGRQQSGRRKALKADLELMLEELILEGGLGGSGILKTGLKRVRSGPERVPVRSVG
jgi:hypothetical protein